ncbi:MAG: hypothetical protein QW057_00405 [Candidatus Bathyarchaeia archaeon]
MVWNDGEGYWKSLIYAPGRRFRVSILNTFPSSTKITIDFA